MRAVNVMLNVSLFGHTCIEPAYSSEEEDSTQVNGKQQHQTSDDTTNVSTCRVWIYLLTYLLTY